MKLRAILPADAVIETGNPDLDVHGVAVDSRAVRPGDLFVAVEGGKTDGLKFAAHGARRRRGGRPRAAGAGDAAAGRHCVRACRQCAARARPDRGEILCPPAGDHRGHHRHERQDLGRRLHAPDLDRARVRRRERRHRRHRLAARRDLWFAHDARSGRAASLARCAGRRGRHPSCDRSFLARSRSIRLDGLRIAAAAFTNLVARSSRLPSDHRGLSRRQASAVRGTGRAGRRRRHRCRSRTRRLRWSPPPGSAACGS